jgi:hypothetical protein
MQLRTNVFFNEAEQIRFKSKDDCWTFDFSFVHCSVTIYTKYWKICQQL